LEILRKNDIRFFVFTTEYDLYTPEHVFFLSMAVEIGEFSANQAALKSLQNRIERAQRGYPTGARKPYGRIWIKETETWIVDKKKQRDIERVAKLYIKGEPLEKLAKSLGMAKSGLHNILKNRCGTEWTQRFRSKRFNINETITTKIPELLPPDLIKRVEMRARDNSTVYKAPIKYKYLLSSIIFCGHCKYALTGAHGKYRHSNYPECRKVDRVRQDIIEPAVLATAAYNLMGKGKLDEAVRLSIPNPEKFKNLQAKLKREKYELNKVRSQKKNVYRFISRDDKGSKDSEAAEILEGLRAREQLIKSEINSITTKLDKIPDPDDKRTEMQLKLQQQILNSYYRSPTRILEMSFDEKREFLLQFFHGSRDRKTRPEFGIFITENKGDKEHPFKFEMKGRFGAISPEFYDHLPLDDFDLIFMLTGTDEVPKKHRDEILLQLNTHSNDHLYEPINEKSRPRI
jgi:hypothetical protein